MVVASSRAALSEGLPMESLEAMAKVNGKELLLTSKGLILEERKSDRMEAYPNDRRKSGERRTC